jgi:muramoyltetrapeptide carboxypeptidase
MNPPYLKPSDNIRIISTSGIINPEHIDGAIKMLSSWGLRVSVGQFARAENGRFAGTKEQRAADLQDALDDPDVKAILCSRGGYGLVQIIDRIDFYGFIKSPKWLIGFSDITILHNSITSLGVASIHSPMAKYLAELPAEAEQLQRLKDILFGKSPSYHVDNELLNRKGTAHGKLIGGNLSVFMGLRGTEIDLPYRNNILFIEDVAEKPYHIDRMMQNLRLSGALSQLSGLVVGQFSECVEDLTMNQTIAEIIFEAVQDYDYPVCFNFPAGHIDFNLPIILNAKVVLTVTEIGADLKF